MYLDKAGIYVANAEMPSEYGWFDKSRKGTPAIRLKLVVAEGEQAGRSIDYYAWLSDGAVDNSIRTLSQAFGWDGDLVALQNGENPFSGKDVEIVVEMESYNGKMRTKVKWLNAIGGGSRASSNETREVESLVQKLARRAKAIAAETKGGAAPQSASAPAPARAPRVVKASDPIEYQDDDIPF